MQKFEIGNQLVILKKGTSSNIFTRDTSAGAATSFTLAVSNANRKELVIHNDSTIKLYIAFGSAASTTNFTVVLAPNGTYILDSTTETINGYYDSTGTGLISSTEIT